MNEGRHARPDDERPPSGKLTPEEDANLRRLHWFERFGAELAPPLKVVKHSIRARDKRSTIREPQDGAVRVTK